MFSLVAAANVFSFNGSCLTQYNGYWNTNCTLYSFPECH